jgi:hypothetical protein
VGPRGVDPLATALTVAKLALVTRFFTVVIATWARETPCQAGMEEAPFRSALIAFHNLQAHRGAQHELPDWAVAAHRSATALAGVLPVVLMTNSPFAADPRVAGPFHRAVRVDLLKSGWTSGLDLGGRLRALCGLKIHALLHGWERGIVGPQVLRHSAPRTRLATPRLRLYAPGP